MLFPKQPVSSWFGKEETEGWIWIAKHLLQEEERGDKIPCSERDQTRFCVCVALSLWNHWQPFWRRCDLCSVFMASGCGLGDHALVLGLAPWVPWDSDTVSFYAVWYDSLRHVCLWLWPCTLPPVLWCLKLVLDQALAVCFDWSGLWGLIFIRNHLDNCLGSTS